MDAYSKVDRVTRKKLDEMLKTWKSPVPGSIDSRPVFSPETTLKIENALLRVKTRTIEYEQQQAREHQELFRRVPGVTPITQWRNTPTPPQQAARYPPPASQGYPQQSYQMNGNYQPPVSIHMCLQTCSDRASPLCSHPSSILLTALPTPDRNISHLLSQLLSTLRSKPRSIRLPL